MIGKMQLEAEGGRNSGWEGRVTQGLESWIGRIGRERLRDKMWLAKVGEIRSLSVAFDRKKLPQTQTLSTGIEKPGKPRDKRRGRRLLRLLGVFVLAGLLGVLGLGIWLDGPGMRWLAPVAARHFLPKLGFAGDLRVEGRISSGLVVTDLWLSGEAGKGGLRGLRVGRIEPKYVWGRLLQGKVDGLVVDQLQADVSLDPADFEPEGKKKEPFELRKLGETLRKVRERVVPMDLRLTGVSATLVKEGRVVVDLAPTGFSHVAGSDDFRLELGAVTDASGREWAGHPLVLGWREDGLRLDRLGPVSGVGVRDVVLQLPDSGKLAAELKVLLDEAVVAVQVLPDAGVATLRMESGRVRLGPLLAGFGVESPVEAGISGMELDLQQVLPDPRAAVGTLALSAEEVAYDGWQVPEARLRVEIKAGSLAAELRARALGGDLELAAGSELVRGEGELEVGDVQGTLRIGEVVPVLQELAQRYPAIKVESGIPQSTLQGTYVVAMSAGKVAGATAKLRLEPVDAAAATAVAVDAGWKSGGAVVARVEMDGVGLDASADLTEKSYQGTLAMDGFSTHRIERWLALAGVEMSGMATASLQWKGGGSWAEAGNHQGELKVAEASWAQPGRAAAGFQLEADYQWPGRVGVKRLEAAVEDQKVVLDAQMQDRWLEVGDFLWTQEGREMAVGSARVPVPDDLGAWREMLENETREMRVAVESRVLPLELLNPWLPETARMDAGSTGKLRIDVAGPVADPAVDFLLECRKLRVPGKPDLPAADMRVAVKAAAGHAGLEASVVADGYAPAVVSASMPCRLDEWAEDPARIKGESFTARADLPRLELARFMKLVPGATRLAGVLTGNVEAGGTLDAPELRGKILLENGAFAMDGGMVPPVERAGVEVDLSMQRVTVNQLRAEVAGGTVSGSGAIELRDNLPAAVDFRLDAAQLPVLRNELMIVRADAGLRLAGPWESARLSGEVGLVDSLFYRDIELLPIGKPFTTPSAASLPKLDAKAAKAEAGRVPAPFNRWGLDVRVRTKDPFLIRGNLASGRVDVDLKAVGSAGDPKLDGTAVLSDFSALLPFSTLNVKSGTVRFTPETGFDPILEVRGTSEPRPYRVSVFVYGRASDPQIMLTSNPPMPEAEIMTLLATGTTTSGLEDTQAAKSRAIQLFAEEVRRGRVKYTRQLRPLLGLIDRVDFALQENDPYSTDAYTTATVRLTDRLFVSAGMDDQGNTRMMGIWRISFK